MDEYNIAAIRSLMLAAFRPEDLRRFCQERPLLFPILADFPRDASLGDMVDGVLDYCLTRYIVGELLSWVRAFNPRMYDKHRAQLITLPQDQRDTDAVFGSAAARIYNPSLLPSWEASLLEGHWKEKIDCRDEVLLQDLRRLLASVLEHQEFRKDSITDVGVALMELCRNVAEHARRPIGEVEIATSLEYRRLDLSVSSEGARFTLESAISKYKEVPPEERVIHGIQNLLTRGEVQVYHASGLNVVRFSCHLSTRSSGESTSLSVQLRPDVLSLGDILYSYGTWYHSLAGTLDPWELPGSGLDADFEPLMQVLLNQWNSSPLIPIPVSVSFEPPDWTLQPIEILVIKSFLSFVSALGQDERFHVVESPLPD